MSVESLTEAQCILLAVHFAVEANIPALHSFTPARLDVLDPELVLRIVLTFLPETLDPKKYSTYISEVASRLYLDVTREDIAVDTSPVASISDAQARKKVKKLDLLEIIPPAFPPHAPEDLLTRFLCHRAYRIDSETGALDLVPKLVTPFLDRNDFIRTWYISVVLPLLRLNYEYYPTQDTPTGLHDWENMEGREGVDFLLSNAAKAYAAPKHENGTIARDVKGLVGPWMYGHTERKRRRLDNSEQEVDKLSDRVRKISLSGVTEQDKTGHDWEYVYRWTVNQAQANFNLVTELIEEWDGPSDLDLGGLDKGHAFYLDNDTQTKLESQYAQAAFASCYAVQTDTKETIQGAHGILARLAELLEFIPPPDLATSVDSLPKIEQHAVKLEESQTLKDLEVEALLKPEHPLTSPRLEAYMLLQMMVYSAYQLSGLGHSMSIVHVAKLHFYSTAEEQLRLLQRILEILAKSGRRDDTQWIADKARLMWLWNWGIDPENSDDQTGAGVLGKIARSDFDQELLKVFIDSSISDVDPVVNVEEAAAVLEKEQIFPFNYSLARELVNDESNALTADQAEAVVLAQALAAYDGASNGNKTRGGVKKANDIITAFMPIFPQSKRLKEISTLVSATHSLSFYALTLQHGVPFKPVSIRVSPDPIELIDKVLDQNRGSYAKLDDLVSIAQNLASSGLGVDSEELPDLDIAQQRKEAERRVTFMAIEAALREDDFETAYSYIVSRLSPSVEDIDLSTPKHTRNVSASSTLSRAKPLHDDYSWRAAYLAGRYRPASSSTPTLRRLEQRTELLSLALLLAPASSLTDILSAWRRCEEETTALHLAQQQEEQAFDDRADRREPSALPGNFTLPDQQPQLILDQKRREMGRMARTDAEAPLSMFDLTRSAARAFSRNVNQIQAARSTASPEPGLDGRPGSPDDGADRVRRRDVVANAVSGGLASGIGWVLGAKPVNQ